MPAGRPRRDPDEVFKFKVTVWLIRGKDDDLIDELEHLEPRQRFGRMKELMRSGTTGVMGIFVAGEDDDLIDELSGLDEEMQISRIKQLMRQGLVDDTLADDSEAEDERALSGLLDL